MYRSVGRSSSTQHVSVTLQLPCSALSLFFVDLELFLSDGLKGEILSKKAKEKKEAFIKRIKEVKLGYAYSYTSLYCLSFWHLTENTN